MDEPISSLTDTDYQLIRDSQIFQGVSVENMEHMFAQCKVLEVSSGSTLIQPNNPNENFYVVLSGALHVYLDDNIDEHYLTLRPGECVGELSIIDGSHTSALVMASNDSRVMELNQETLWRLVKASHGIARNLLYILAKRMRNDNRAIISGMRLQHELQQAASIDGLTGLYNRRWMNDYFQRQIARTIKDNKPLTMMLADLDHFKLVNDTYGHVVGDDVLRSVATVLSQNIRPSDLLARFGGEEFVMILPDTNTEEALQVAERVRSAMEQARIQINDNTTSELQITVSIGIAGLALGDDMEKLLARADQALYRAKDNGRNRIESI